MPGVAETVDDEDDDDAVGMERLSRFPLRMPLISTATGSSLATPFSAGANASNGSIRVFASVVDSVNEPRPLLPSPGPNMELPPTPTPDDVNVDETRSSKLVAGAVRLGRSVIE